MRGEAVAERVHGKPRVLVDLIEESRHRLLDGAHADAPTGAREKECVAIARAAAEVPEQLVALRLVIAQREHRMIPNRSDALLSPLPPHLDLLRHEVDVAAAQTLELREAHPRRVEELEDGQVADVGEAAFPSAHLGHLKQ